MADDRKTDPATVPSTRFQTVWGARPRRTVQEPWGDDVDERVAVGSE